jgi:Domain of unknown function (DUF4338)
MTGVSTMATRRCYWKLSSMSRGSTELANGAANWIALGETSGKGRMDRHHKARGTLKRVFVLPLHRRVQQRLCATDPPNVSLTNAD